MDDSWFASIFLESEQEELLSRMVEAERQIPRERRRPFLYAGSGDGGHLLHEGLRGNESVYEGDLTTLAERGLLRLGYGGHGTPNYDVTPEGRAYYEYMKRRSGRPAEQVAEEVRSYLDSDSFQRSFPKAYKLWTEAEELLWGAETSAPFTEIGHKTREAMQEFATSLVLEYQPPDAPSDPAKTIARLRATIAHTRLSSAVSEAIKSLVSYWGAVSDLVQRQEHGAQKEGDPLQWEDARRVVFLTAVVMFEAARVLKLPS